MGEPSLLPRNLGLDLVRATEAAAIDAGRWMGLGQPVEADLAATKAMHQALCELNVNCQVVTSEARLAGDQSPLGSQEQVGALDGVPVDLVVDAIDGRTLLAQGRSGALAVAALAPRGTVRSIHPAIYVEKIVVNRYVGEALVEECLDAPAAWTLALIARVKDKPVRDLTVFVLDRPRHQHLIEEIRQAGARVMLRADGDIAGALMAAYPDDNVDVLLGIGGANEGVIAACAVRALGGAMLIRPAPQSAEEKEAIQAIGLEPGTILNVEQLASSPHIFFSATGITDGPLLKGVRYKGRVTETQSLVLRGEFGTRRIINAEHVAGN